MKMANGPMGRITVTLGVALLAALAGCVGFVGDDEEYGDGGGDVIVTGPDLYLFGGGYDRGRDVHDYSHRGHESRAAAHPERRTAPHSESHAPAQRGGGGHEEKR